MSQPAKLNALHHAENPARELLEKLGSTFVPRETLAAERGGEHEDARLPVVMHAPASTE